MSSWTVLPTGVTIPSPVTTTLLPFKNLTPLLGAARQDQKQEKPLYLNRNGFSTNDFQFRRGLY